MVTILIPDTFENVILKFFNHSGLLISEDMLQCLIRLINQKTIFSNPTTCIITFWTTRHPYIWVDKASTCPFIWLARIFFCD